MGALENGKFRQLEAVVIEEEEQDSVAIQEAVKVLLHGLGEDVNREGLKKTPVRVAKALREATSGYRQNVKDIVGGALFPEAAFGRVHVQGLHLFSFCESCLLPFQIKCHVSYVPTDGTVVGLSKLSRVSTVYARRLQDPQRLANEICSALYHEIKSAGVGVVLQCSHIRFPSLESFLLDSNNQGWVKEIVRSGSGVFEDDKADVWVDFSRCLKLGGINVDISTVRDLTKHSWCPSQCISTAGIATEIEPPKPDMVAAVASIIRSLGEDPSRKELVDTPSRFVRWLMNFQNLNLDMKLNGFLCGRADSVKCNGEADSHNDQVKEQIHCEQNLALWSQCEHHLLPFYGKVHIGYFCPKGFTPIGKSLLQSIVHFYGFKLQVQERITTQIANAISSIVAGDVIVLVEAEHMCMICRGVNQIGSKTITDVRLGRFETDKQAQDAVWDDILSSRASGVS